MAFKYQFIPNTVDNGFESLRSSSNICIILNIQNAISNIINMIISHFVRDGWTLNGDLPWNLIMCIIVSKYLTDNFTNFEIMTKMYTYQMMERTQRIEVVWSRTTHEKLLTYLLTSQRPPLACLLYTSRCV